MTGILIAYHDDEYKSERMQSLTDCRKTAAYGERHEILVPFRIISETYATNTRNHYTTYDRGRDGTYLEHLENVYGDGPLPKWVAEFWNVSRRPRIEGKR